MHRKPKSSLASLSVVLSNKQIPQTSRPVTGK